MLDNSLSGMCLADELRDVLGEQSTPFVPRAASRPRKRPSSILSVALAKMEHSTCIPDGCEQEGEPSKRSRLSVQPHQSEDFELKEEELKAIREHLVELQVYTH